MWRGTHHLRVDLGLAVVSAGLMLLEGALSSKVDVRPATTVAVVAASAPILLRRRWPALALVLCLVGVVAVLETSLINRTMPLPTMIVGYTLALAHGRRRALVVATLVLPLVLLIIDRYSPHGVMDFRTVEKVVLLLVPLVFGVAEHERRRAYEQETRSRVGEERLRIARDVHDVVAHAMVAINVQAGVGAHLLDRDPEQARRTLLDIKRTSGEALTDLRATLGVLRDHDDADDVPVAPTLSLRELEALAARFDAAGLRLELDVEPTTGGLPAAVDATGYRIVREALTNVLRHASAEEARVRVRCETDRVVIEVEDDGRGRRTPVNGHAPGTGNGLRGMRERALAVGGTLEAGPRAQGGWRVHACLPVGSAP